MAKLYLIRRNLESFSGPMSLIEMKAAYKRMQFGLQDEVSGHCGPWVTFEDLARIKKNYPEIARIVNEDMLAGWGVSDHGSKLVNEDTRKLDVKATRGIGLALTFLVIALVAFAAAVYMANGSRMSGKNHDGDSLTPEQAMTLLNGGDELGFSALIEDDLPDLVERATRVKRPETAWLPILRHYAFMNEGQLPNFPPKLLRGEGADFSPVDCSLKSWRKRWRDSLKTWNDFLGKKRLIRQHWSYLLAWDPHWIRRREMTGWLPGENYYTGCLTIADKALTEMFSDATLVSSAADWEKMGINKIKQRLSWLVETSKTGQAGMPFPSASSNVLAGWTCLEAARDVKELQKCRDVIGAPQGSLDQDIWASYSEERFGWNLLRLVIPMKGALPPELLTLLTQQSTKMNKTDHFTRFDYRVELKLMRILLKQVTPIEKAVEKSQAEFPEVRLTH